MTIPEILVWEATNALLLIPVVIALVILTRWYDGNRCSPTGIGISDRPSTGESYLASSIAQIRSALVRRRGHRLC